MNARLESVIRDFLERKGLLSEFDNFDLENLRFVTVGVCVKNSERTIGECLESITGSDYDKLKLEIIVVDGNSVDNTVAIARDVLEKSGMAFKILSDEGRGLGYARQLVVDNAKGEYICWIDGDNVLPQEFLKQQVKFAEKNRDVSIFIPIILPKERNTIARLEGYTWLLPTLNAIKKHKTAHLAMQGTLTRTKTLRVIGGFNIAIKGAGEDTELFGRFLQKGYKITVSPNSIIYHHTRASWKRLYRQVSWWAKTQPRLPKKVLFKQVVSGILLFTKLSPFIITDFKDFAGFLMPFYTVVWNSWYFIHSFR